MIINGQRLLELSPIVNMEKEKKKKGGLSYGLSEAGYDIRIKQDVEWRYNGEKMLVRVDSNKSWGFSYGRFALASSVEKFKMPNHLVAVVHDKSTWARKGLSVFNTVIEPGWKGWLTLELVYHGQESLKIPAGSPIAQVLFHRTAEMANYKGKYQGQGNKPVQSRFE